MEGRSIDIKCLSFQTQHLTNIKLIPFTRRDNIDSWWCPHLNRSRFLLKLIQRVSDNQSNRVCSRFIICMYRILIPGLVPITEVPLKNKFIAFRIFRVTSVELDFVSNIVELVFVLKIDRRRFIMNTSVSNAKNCVVISEFDDIQRLRIFIWTKKHIHHLSFIFSISRKPNRVKKCFVSKFWNGRKTTPACIFFILNQSVNVVPNKIDEKKFIFFWPEAFRDECRSCNTTVSLAPVLIPVERLLEVFRYQTLLIRMSETRAFVLIVPIVHSFIICTGVVNFFPDFTTYI
mmetsp:Transcript_11206/g.23644  ORF Transcript_11206/g.23644 Transcript_11206/m.23644 type:complete len:289 (-) Transcript_11206:923-1789(-)